MLNLTPLDPPEPSFASLCRQFGQALWRLFADTLRLAAALAIVWFILRLAGALS